MLTAFLWGLAAFVVGVVVASFFEWALHRYVMHRPLGRFRYAFKAHAVVHHRVFRADHTYHLQRPDDRSTIPMAWWNGPLLVALGSLPFGVAALMLSEWAVFAGGVVAFSAYYGTYEYIHWCMHLPKARRVERSTLFRRLNGHHLLHHRCLHKNFNVVLPLADVCLRTFLPRSRTHFAQAQGAAVPSVQPRPA